MRESGFKKKLNEKQQKLQEASNRFYAELALHLLICKHVQNLADSYQSIENTLNN